MSQQLRKIRRFGWIPDLPDHRDFRYSAPASLRRRLPPSVDLTARCPAVYDQQALGSCTANAIAGAIAFNLTLQGVEPFVPSRLFIYYNERVMEGTVETDSGAMLRDGMKSVNQQGACPEPMWPYFTGQFASKPPASCYKEALRHQVLAYHRVPRTLSQMQGCLAEGFPFVFGFAVYASFESDTVARTGVVNMPRKNESMIGGHAVLAVGYNATTKRFIVRNSWGPQWGKSGYFTMPFDYLMDEHLADDFWTIRKMEA